MGRHQMTDAGTCNGCNRPMRRQGVSAAEAPGTMQRSGPGLCTTCRLKEARPNYKERDRQIPIGTPDPTLAAWRIVYEADRRHRGIDPNGIPDEQL